VTAGSVPDVSRVNMVDRRVAAILRAMSGAERLRLAHEEWLLVRERFVVFLAARHPAWGSEEVEREVAKRLLGGSG
jgi:hypothetical protein